VTDNPKLWLFSMQETLSKKDFQKLLIICWAIWGARQKALHEDLFQSPLSTFAFISKFMDDMELAGFSEDSKITKTIGNKQSTPKWIPSPEGFLKFNVDGAVARSENKGATAQGIMLLPVQWLLMVLSTLLPLKHWLAMKQLCWHLIWVQINV
jgi:hypothetical protein